MLRCSKEIEMKRFLIGLAAMVVALAVVGSVQAAGKNGGSSGGNRGVNLGGIRKFVPSGGVPKATTLPNTGSFIKKLPTVPSHHPHHGGHHGNKNVGHGHGHHFLHQHAKKYHFGYCFPGRHHAHWTNRCWNPHYGCYVYWCPYSSSYYYWCAPHGCYYPIGYCPTGHYAY
jgi:hypothetical protein